MRNDNRPINTTQVELDQFEHPAWDEPIICRVEVDLPGWLAQLTGDRYWEICGEDEEDTCISFIMRQKDASDQAHFKHIQPKQAEVTLYHNGYAVVDVDGKAVFDGSLTAGTSNCAHLSYYHATGEQIILN
ncbi:MAG: hypothetical protein SFU55_06430 [Methylophilus sp.]|nr:hypothetical protein [Methylophilus sp.]